MRCIIKGLVSGSESFKLFKAADDLDIPVRVLQDDGTPISLTGVTTTVEVYANANRSGAVVKTFATTTVTAASGAAKIVPTVAAVNFGPGLYYAFVKTDTSGAIAISKNFVLLKVG